MSEPRTEDAFDEAVRLGSEMNYDDTARPVEPPAFESIPIERVAVHQAGEDCDGHCRPLHVRWSPND